MPELHRILSPEPVDTLEEYVSSGGGLGLQRAVEMAPGEIIETIEASGLRGRGGAGFPTGVKWRTVAEMSTDVPSTVVVNGAEGEPGSFKDRTLIRNNPFQVIEGALIAARAVGATEIVIAVKEQFEREVGILTKAIDEFRERGLTDVTLRLVTGPSSYLFGEESALLEVVDGRLPLPRVNPPYRRGIGDVAGTANASSDASLAGDEGARGAPALVNNVETMANVAYILREGIEAFRDVGTPATPGTTICTVTGAVQRHAVGEFAMGTPLWEVIDTLGHGPVDGHTLIAAISGTANTALTADQFDTPLCFDALHEVGSGLGASGFILFDEHTDFAATAHGVARFLAIESCGQCEPCKIDGARIAEKLDRVRRSQATAGVDDDDISSLLSTVADGARCGLAAQHQSAVASLHQLARTATAAHLDGSLPATNIDLVAPILDIVDDEAILDRAHLDKALDWSTDGTDSGTAPADRSTTSRHR